jgi:hypothetical protein
MARRSFFAAAVCAVAVAGAGATSALAGEVIGPPGSVGHPGTPLEASEENANSICVFSGLNDFINGPTDFIVQSYGQDVRLHGADPTDKSLPFPGNSCQGFSNPDRK